MDVDVEDIILGNGASELIVMAMQALLNSGDEMLIPPGLPRCGPPRSPQRRQSRCIIAATRPMTGSPTSRTCRPGLRPIPAASW